MNVITLILNTLVAYARRFAAWWTGQFKSQKPLGKIILGLVTALAACCICSVPFALFVETDSTPDAAEVAEAAAEPETPAATAESRTTNIELEATTTNTDPPATNTDAPVTAEPATAAPTRTPRAIQAATDPSAATSTVAPTEPPPTQSPPTSAPTIAPTAAPTLPPAPTATSVPPTAVPPTSPPSEPTLPPEPTTPPQPTAPLPVAGGPLAIIGVNKQAEYVDIQNTSAADVDLNGWVLLSELGNQDCPLRGVLPAGQPLRIWARSQDAGQGGFNCGFGDNIWNNDDRDPAVLIDPAGNEVSRR